MHNRNDVTPQARLLTSGETALAASVFGGAIDTGRVIVHHAKWWALQPWWVTMAPDGHIWCHPNGGNWSNDFAAEGLGGHAHFIHEMVHVWQVQTGGHLALRRPPWARYRYEIVPGKPFARYGIEQQACIVEHGFVARARGDAAAAARLAAIIPFDGWRP